MKKIFYFSIFLLLLAGCSPKKSADKTIIPPLKENQFKTLTKSHEIEAFIKKIDSISPLIKSKCIGKSVKGKSIYTVEIANDKKNNKTKVLFFAQQHGNEPGGKEGMLLMLAKFANHELDYLLDSLDIYIIPQLNPDGADVNWRRNAADVDPNRDHLIMESPEVQALHRYFDSLMPHMSVDFHEYFPYTDSWKEFGYLKQFDVQLGALTNTNIDPGILDYSKKKALPFVEKQVKHAGFSYFEYTLGHLPGNERMRHSTVDINDGRQSVGIMNTLSFIVEGLNGKDSTERIKERALVQYEIGRALANFAYKNASTIRNLVDEAREDLKNGQPQNVGIRLEHVKDSQKLLYPVKSIDTGNDTTFVIDAYHTKVISELTVKKPKAYLVPKKDNLLTAILEKHNVQYKEIPANLEEDFYEYNIKKVITDTVEELATKLPTLEKTPVKVNKSKYYYVPLNQLKGNLLVLALEPQSTLGLVNYRQFDYLLKGSTYPVLRVE